MLIAQGTNARAYPLDVTKTASCAQVVDQVLDAYGRIDILVNNAGLFILHKSEEIPEEHWRLQVDVMLNGAFFMTQAVARAAMIPQRRGAVVNIASIGGMGGWPMRSAYNAAKAGLIVLTEVLATEWAQYNIRLNCVSPSVTRTDMMDGMIKSGSGHAGKVHQPHTDGAGGGSVRDSRCRTVPGVRPGKLYYRREPARRRRMGAVW